MLHVRPHVTSQPRSSPVHLLQGPGTRPKTWSMRVPDLPWHATHGPPCLLMTSEHRHSPAAVTEASPRHATRMPWRIRLDALPTETSLCAAPPPHTYTVLAAHAHDTHRDVLPTYSLTAWRTIHPPHACITLHTHAVTRPYASGKVLLLASSNGGGAAHSALVFRPWRAACPAQLTADFPPWREAA